MSKLEGYAQYYQRALDFKVNGYKPVAGGTGLGKTHGAIECIKENRFSHKFIYVSHRHNLLEEMAAKLEEEGINYRYLRSDTEIIKRVLKDHTLCSQMRSLLEDSRLKEYATYARRDSNGDWRYKESSCSTWINEALNILMLQEENREEELEALNPNEELGKKSTLILGFFKKIFFSFSEVQKMIRSNQDQTFIAGYNFQVGDIDGILAEFPVIFELFPYWDYDQSEQIPVALVTIQKMFLGLFDGKRNVNIHTEKDRVFFLDEFEFLESELLELIISESKLDNPFVFIAYFYHNMCVKLLDENYLGQYPEVRKSLEEIKSDILKLKQKSLFPEIRSFGMKGEKIIKSFIGSSLYQANYTSVERPIYLEIDESLKRYWLIADPRKETLTTFQLMRGIKRISNRILQFYLALKIKNERLYFELVEDAYEKTEYLSYLNKLSFFSVVPSRRNTMKRINNFSFLYHRGYGVYVLNKPSTHVEPNEVFLEFHMVNSSPERCLLELISKNMVFGLSATAHIPRCLEHFNETWLKDEIEYEANEGICYMDLDEIDKKIIQSLSHRKAKNRENTLEISITKKSCQASIHAFLKELKGDRKVKEIDSNHDFHIDRLIHFFSTLEWIRENPLVKAEVCDSHLIFFNSITQVKTSLSLLHKGYTTLEEITIDNAGTHYFDITFFGKNIIIVPFDSSSHRHFFGSRQGQEEYQNLFQRNRSVVLVTQYPSANNGVNLQYRNPISGRVEDFQNIHLLEVPHFYFSHGAKRTDVDMKKDIWKLSQLVLDAKIPKSEFSQKIKKIANGSNDLNKLYKELNDYTLNQIAKIIQALGRIERTNSFVGLQRGRVSRPVLDVFSKYFYNPEIQTTVADASPYFSSFTHSFFAEIKGHCDKVFDSNNKNRPSGILEEDRLFLESFEKLLKINSIIRSGKLGKKQTEDAIHNWREIRKAALSFDFSSGRLKGIHGIFYSPHLHLKDGISWSKETGEIWPLRSSIPHQEVINWDFNTPFRKLINVVEVRNYFSSQGYPLEFKDRYNYRFFTPSFYQQIYLGALGEEVCKSMFFSRQEKVDIINPEDLATDLFEIVDFVIQEKNWFVDAKFYSEANMIGTKSDGLLSKKIKQDAKPKIQKLRSYDPLAKLIIINANSDENGITSYFDQNFNPAQEGQEDIIVFPGLTQLREYMDIKEF